MNSEYVWFLLPIIALLSQLGGTFNKLYRRLAIPTAITLSALLFLGWSWWWVALWLAYLAVTRLPFTLIGDGIGEHWFNWPWIFISGYLISLPAVIIGIQTSNIALALISCLIPCFTRGIIATLSNLKFARNYVQWKFVEGIVWFMVGFPPALLITLR